MLTSNNAHLQHQWLTSNSSDKIELFLLPIILLPGGRQRLKIIDAKHLVLITRVLKKQCPLVMAFDYPSDEKLYPWGVQVEVTNFSQTKEGFLTIDIHARQMVVLLDYHQAEPHRWFCHIEARDHWSQLDPVTPSTHLNPTQLNPTQAKNESQTGSELNQETTYINEHQNQYADQLKSLFKAQPLRAELYTDTYFSQLEWVAARLIEQLPLPYQAQKEFLKPNSFQHVVHFLNTLLKISDPN
ncbi:hypothetical protein HC725_07560 [Vibrio sp. S17_S38]|uniref:hypothetical protein n=1 Tax=Vibrio sp. S17_S38 TaxID=2720229 RepID=UPI0016801993|nr:hypothetical protein [Vibrio sp. S17_S38]MBD1573135.1 hypothetical protein [Vibrio sp. S17_S38]